ncbi:hypothetical protein PHACT_14790 [Pseudohongiella acticola]|jgi:2-dehydropantoate 2-reductase|uniref:2-dehydropantoate 2-reductase n=1 Tax=Pseudohongiella acticola TaxID=1524254 RepID=A0A1E8CFZ1_9GAMM|nr:2-dehydropantoate 2-reductase [Pseudohongiella acticola]OFE11117.1 hypothetical protein PHACT_14790 [Pseudohongiella acticola]
MTLTDKPIPTPTRWHILGAGAMGCLWACAMHSRSVPEAHTGAPVTLLLRNRAALSSYPGHITCSDLPQSLNVPARTVCHDSGTTTDVINNLLVATKAQDTMAAIASVSSQLAPDSRLVLLQNGLKVQQELSRLYGTARVFCLSTSQGAWLREPFNVVHAGDGDTWLGQLAPASAETPAPLQRLLDMLPAQQLNIRIDNNIGDRLWRKLAINCAINALTVIHDCRNGELLHLPDARQTLTALCNEISQLLPEIAGAPAMPDLSAQVQHVLTVTADNVSSTLQDIRRGRATEIDHLNGYLCNLAAQQHLPCPVNQSVLQQMRVIESQALRA